MMKTWRRIHACTYKKIYEKKSTLLVKFVISGTPNANIRIFMIERSYQKTPLARIKVTCEDWNGASWSEVADLSTARTNIMRSGTSSSAACIGGATAAPANTGATEEWSSVSDVVKTLTD